MYYHVTCRNPRMKSVGCAPNVIKLRMMTIVVNTYQPHFIGRLTYARRPPVHTSTNHSNADIL